MVSTQSDGISRKSKRELKDYPLNKLYIALKIILISSTIGMQNAFAVDLPSADAGCIGGTATCTVTSALGTDFDITADITPAGTVDAIIADSSVTGSTFTVDSGLTVTGNASANGFNFLTGSSANNITNNGTIQGGNGINFNGGNNFTIINNGVIDSTGTGSFYALANFGDGLTLTNNEGATISGKHTAIEGDASSSGGTTINNAGSITTDDGASGVAIKLYGSNNTINLNTSSNITGDIQLVPGQTGNVLNLLDGSASVGTFSNYLNNNSLNTLNINAPGLEWDLTNTLPVAGAINIIAGNVVVTGDLSSTTADGTTIGSGSTLQIGNGGTTGTLDSVVVNDGTLTFNRSDDVTISQDISGTGNVVQAGAGVTNLAANGTWSGGTQVTSGTLNGMAATNALGTGAVSVTNGAILQLGDASTFADYYFSANALSLDASTLRMNGSQATAISGNVTYHFDNLTSPISLSNSTLDFEQAASANIIFNGDLDAINTSSLNYVADSGAHTLAMNGNLTGSGTFSVNMSENTPDSLGLSFNGAANNYTGTLSLNGDAYTVDVNTLLGQASWSITGQQTLNFNGANTHAATAISTSANSVVNITDTDTTLQVGAGTVKGVIGGLGNLTKTSTGILALDGVNTYTGTTEIAGGTINFGVANAIAASSSVKMDTNTTLGFKNFDQTLQNLNGTGTITLGSGDLTAQNNIDTAFSGKISGTGDVIKTGTGALSLSGNANSVGATTVNAGNLHFAQNGVYTTTGLTVNTGATAQLDGTAQITSSGAADIEGDLNVALGGTTPKITSDTATLGAGSTLDVSGFSPVIATKASDLSGTRTVVLQTTGGITGNFGTVNGVTASGVDYYFNDAKLSTDGKNYSLGSELAWTSGTSQATGNFTLADAGDTFNVDVALGDETANGSTWDGKSLTKLGAGNLTLSSANTYSGTTSVEAGTLTTGIANAFADSTVVNVASGATLSLNNFSQMAQDLTGAGAITLGTGTLTAQNNNDTAFDGTITGTGGLTKTGTGTLTLSGAGNSVGAADVSAGTLHLTQNGTFNAASLLVDTGATAQLDSTAQVVTSGNSTVNGTLDVTLGGTGPMITASDANLGTSSVLNVTGFTPVAATKASDLNAARTVVINTTGGITGDFSSVTGISPSDYDYISNNARKSGDGNSYSVGSELTWNAGPTLSSGDFTLVNAGDAFDVDVVLGNQTPGNSGWDGTSLTKLGAGNLTLSAANTYTGATSIQAGTLTGGVIDAIATSSSVNVADGATLALNNFNQLVQDLSGAGIITLGTGTLTAQSNTNTAFDGAITGTGGLSKTGNGTLTLSSTGNSVGAANISAGKLHLTQDGVFNASTLSVDNGATLTLDADSQVVSTGSAVFDGTLDITLGGASPLVTAAGANINATSSTLNISGYTSGAVAKASDLDGARTVIIHTTGGITGDFQDVEGVGAGNADYIVTDAKKSADGFDYTVGSSLAWNAAAPLSTGTFTLNDADTFNVDVVLADQTANGSVWDGTTLTKAGTGTLMLSAVNTYTGGTKITGGVLQTGVENALVTSSAVVVDAGATFDLNNYNQQVANLSGEGNVTLGSATLTLENNTNEGLNGVISGTGGLVKEGTGSLTLGGVNTYSGGTVINGGRVSLVNESSLGDVSGDVTINNNAELAVSVPGEFVYDVQLGTGGGTIIGTSGITMSGVIGGSGPLTTRGIIDVTADNTYTGGTTISANSTLSMGRRTTTGSVIGDITNNGTLALTRSNDFTLDGVISGTGHVDALGTGTATLTGVNTYTGGTNVLGGLRVTGDGTLGSGAVAIASPGSLFVDAPNGGSYTFGNALSGSGTLKASLGAGTDVFAFGAGTGAAFTGTVELGQGQFALDGDNTTALTGATLQLDAGNTTVVAAADQNIGNLTLNGGTMSWSGQTPPQGPAGKVTVTDLALNSGTVQVDVPVSDGVPNPVPSPGANILAQDDGEIQAQLIAASGTVTGDASTLGLVDSTGQAVSNPQTLAITEGTTTVANGSYNFLLSTGSNNDGLYLGYGLTALDLVTGQTLHLAPDSGATTTSAALNAVVSGGGNLDLNGSASADQTLTLSNVNNTYTGSTTVSGGTLVAGTDNALGATSGLILQGSTGFDLNGKTQTIGSLSGAAGSTLNVNGGNLTLSQGGQSEGSLTGAGNLTVTDGSLTVNGANSGLSAAVVLNNTAQALLDDVAALGTGTVNLNGAGTGIQITGATGTLVNALSGTGAASVLGGSAVTLSGNNNGFGGSFTIDNTSSLTATTAENLGTASVSNDGVLNLDSGTDWAFSSVVSRAGALQKAGSGNITVGSANTYTGGTAVNAGTLTLTNAQGIGTGAATVSAPGTLAVNLTNGNFSNSLDNAGLFTLSGDGNQLSSAISGNGINRISATNLSISGDNSAFGGAWDLASGSSSTITSAQNLGTGSALLNGTLNVAPASGNFAFTNALTGQGALNVAMTTAADRFSFGAGSGNAFAGNVSLGQGAFQLSGTDTLALTNATLQNQSANITVGAGNQNIGNLAMNGGTTTFDVLTHSQITTNQLALNGGEVRVNGLGTLPDPANAATEPLLQQDDIIGDPLILSQGNTGSSANLTLTDGSGNVLAPTTANVTQLGKVVGVGTYGYGLTGSNLQDQTGLFLYSGLIKLNLLAGQQLSLVQDGSAPVGGNEMHALITGAGGLNLDVVNSVTLNNPLNDYTGSTTVTNGTLRLGFDHTLGNTSSLDLLGTSQVDLNGKTQSIGALNSAADTVVNLNGGTLTITDSQRAAGDTNGGTVNGRLTGSGQLIVDPSILTIDGANPTLSATTLITGGSQVRLNNVQGLGTGSITMDAADDLLTFDTFNGQTASGALANQLLGAGSVQLDSTEVISLAADNSTFSGNFTIGNDATLIVSENADIGTASVTDNGKLQIDNAADMTLNNIVTGTGGLVKNGAGTLTVYQPAYSGTTDINSGTVIVGDGTQTGAKLGADGAGVVTVASGATLAGNGTISGDVTNNGTVAALNSLSAYGSAAASVLNLSGNLTNNGLLQLAGGTIGNTLSVGGNYVGGGVLALRTVLGGDNSVTDKLAVAGDTSGTTQVTVQNAGGNGAQTTTGIQVVDVGGASNGVFSLNGRAVAGAYEYHLVKNTTNGDWYLQSGNDTPVPPQPPEPPTPSSNNFRPEPGAYLANQRAAQNMFLHTLYDRSGAARSSQDTDMAKGWVRLGGDYTKQKSNGGLYDEKTHTTLVQLGSDLYQLDGVKGDQINAGVMAGYGHSSSNTSVKNSTYEASGQVNGYSIGAYGTWYEQPDRVTGAYVDSWIQHAWYKNDVNGDSLPQESYDSQGTDVSLETGYGFAMKQSDEVRWVVTPQAQLIYSHYETDGHTEQNGTRVNANGDDGIRSRMGVRLSRQNTVKLNSAQPFVEVNWYNGKPASDSVDFNKVRFENATSVNRYEVKAGVTGSINEKWQTWGQVSSTWGDNNYQGYQGMVGVKYQW
ncbi:autotransporter outer membrane beta-barrel domain-containing protein (plasmid) [Enterobacteriaceae bacterium Kacie_13]|nr:autotransporter outer membrane beta-barrel domain-containing protein [Enterobacteriaceae bacterium Kacie_13]